MEEKANQVELCPRCKKELSEKGRKEKIEMHTFDLENSLKVKTSIADPTFPLQHVEELRRVLQAFLKKEVLDAILELYKELMREPISSEAFSWFVENGSAGAECKYALAALRQFKRERLEKTIELMETCLPLLKEMQNEKKSS